MTTQKPCSKKRGAILGVVLIVVLVVTTLGSGLIALSQADAVEVSKVISAAEAFWAAEAGLERTRAIAGKNRLPFDQIPLFASGQMNGVINGIAYTVEYPAPAGWNNNSSRVKRYDITSTGVSRGGVPRQVMIDAEIQTFASFMHASHDENGVYFANGDILDGTVYVNDVLNIYGNPQFLRRTYSAESTVNYQASVRPDTSVDPAVFTAGLTLGALALDFSDRDQYVDALETAARSGGLVLDGDFRVVFNDNGTVTHQEWERTRVRLGRRWVWVEGWGTPVIADVSSGNGAIYVNGDATISGEVRGSLTLAARSDVFIEDDITYASATTPKHSDVGFDDDAITDAFGVIAPNSVEITKRGEINIHGSMFVTGGGFGAAGRSESLGVPSINLFGGITQYRRGIVGYTSGKGFSKNYRYDARLLTQPPSQFPYSTYTISNWRQSG